MPIFPWSNYSKPPISCLALGTWFYHSFHGEDRFTRQEECALFLQSFSLLPLMGKCFFFSTQFTSSVICWDSHYFNASKAQAWNIVPLACTFNLLLAEFFTSSDECVLFFLIHVWPHLRLLRCYLLPSCHQIFHELFPLTYLPFICQLIEIAQLSPLHQ